MVSVNGTESARCFAGKRSGGAVHQKTWYSFRGETMTIPGDSFGFWFFEVRSHCKRTSCATSDDCATSTATLTVHCTLLVLVRPENF
jgi:hypothetical protein